MNIDTNRLRGDIAALAIESHDLKKILRATWTREMKDEQRKLVRLRRRATELHVLLAFSRGKLHLQKPLREGAYPGMKWDQSAWHAQVAERVAKDYAVAIEPVGVAS
jgi:hypothetical protein